ncbi:MAG: Stk1 family PASTA domain-containing Ser/Thr kinase [Mycobacterium sp.]
MTLPQPLSERYELGDVIGFGGMSEVHLARDLRLHRNVAVKVLRADLARDPNFLLRFRREARNAAGLNHPAIVAVHDTGEAETAGGPVPYIVMEYVDGVTLRDVLDRSGPIEPRRAIEVISDACQALNYSHQHGIIHRDVKPANIMINKAGAVKVMDFGIARALHDDGVSLTQTAAVIGTAQYLSPEQASGDKVDARSDVYSLGCVLYEILTGKPLFVGDTPVSVAYQHVRKKPSPPSKHNPDLSPELDAVVLKSLAKKPDERYQSAADMRADLIRVRTGQAPQAPKPPKVRTTDHDDDSTSPTLGRRGGATRRWLVVAAVLAVLAVVATFSINAFVGGPSKQVPNLAGQDQTAAEESLRGLGFKTVVNEETNDEIAVGHVIGTDPAANTDARLDDEITINVSSGSRQQTVPDVAQLSYAEAEAKLNDAGFETVTRRSSASTTVPKDQVIGTVPAGGQTSAVSNQIVVEVSSGPDSKQVPVVADQTADVARQNLNAFGFLNTPTLDVDGIAPAGQVVGTVPAAGESASVDTPIQIQVSKGNQFVMPTVTGRFWDDVLPLLQGLGWTGVPDNDQIPAGDGNRAKVIAQTPAPNTPTRKDAIIKLTFGA